MPTYNFLNKETNEVFSEFFSLSEREDFLEKNPHIEQLPPDQVTIISGRMGGLKNDDGWKENMSKIASAHPNSELASQYGDKSIKAVKTREAVNKWKKKRALDTR